MPLNRVMDFGKCTKFYFTCVTCPPVCKRATTVLTEVFHAHNLLLAARFARYLKRKLFMGTFTGRAGSFSTQQQKCGNITTPALQLFYKLWWKPPWQISSRKIFLENNVSQISGTMLNGGLTRWKSRSGKPIFLSSTKERKRWWEWNKSCSRRKELSERRDERQDLNPNKSVENGVFQAHHWEKSSINGLLHSKRK